MNIDIICALLFWGCSLNYLRPVSVMLLALLFLYIYWEYTLSLFVLIIYFILRVDLSDSIFCLNFQKHTFFFRRCKSFFLHINSIPSHALQIFKLESLLFFSSTTNVDERNDLEMFVINRNSDKFEKSHYLILKLFLDWTSLNWVFLQILHKLFIFHSDNITQNNLIVERLYHQT